MSQDHIGSAIPSENVQNGEMLRDAIQQKEEKVPQQTIQSQMQQSARHMAKLRADSTELVTNVLLTAEARESERRGEIREANKLSLAKMENEATSCIEKLNKVMNQLSQSETKNIPEELREDLKKQQELCGQIFEDKDKLINEVQQEIKAKEDRFKKDRKRESEEIDLLINRMQEQISSLKKEYRKELDLIESTFSDEWRDLLTSSTDNWEQQRKKQNDKELEYIQKRMKLVEKHQSLLNRLRMENADLYTKLKRGLESDVQHLLQDLEKKKDIYMVNQEKLKYKMQMLKNHEQDYVTTSAKQIKKITKLQGTRIKQKQQHAAQEKQSYEDVQSLIDQYNRLNQQQKEIQERIRHFEAVGAKRYKDIWLMLEDEAKLMVNRALDLDRIIHEQVLGLTWTPPPMPFMDRSSPKQPQPTVQQVDAQGLGEQHKTWDEPEDTSRLDDSGSLENSMADLDNKFLKEILEHLCDEMGFLLDSKLLEQLPSLERNEQTFLKLNSIFYAMGVENEEDANKLVKFILKYKQPEKEENMSMNNNQAENMSSLINPNDLLGAIRAFTDQYYNGHKSQHEDSVLELEMKDSEVKAYWENIVNIIPNSQLKVWSALESGLNTYYTELTKRDKILTETRQLKQEILELNMLIQKYQMWSRA